jgi:voltage-gated sodium channel
MTDAQHLPSSGLRARAAAFVESEPVHRVIIALIAFNAVTLGLETSAAMMARWGGVLEGIDAVVLGVFVVELALKLFGHGLRFFRNGWNVFDLAIVGIALMPASGAFSVLRALRILRVFRLVSAVPQMRVVVESVFRALPGLGSIAAMLVLFFYIFAVMATKLFGADHPAWFGSLGSSMFTLFQIMTLEGWAEVARETMAVRPAAWLFFVAFILLATFTVLNLFIAVIVNAMQQQHEALVASGDAAPNTQDSLLVEIRGLRQELAELRARSAEPRRPA